jgi:hypothetical protein
MRSFFRSTQGGVLLLAIASLWLGGCASLMSSAANGLADNLSSAILNQDDPETVKAGAPSYMLLLDSFLEGDPDNPNLLAAAATLYASYGAVFADDPDRAERLTARARSYAQGAMCQGHTVTTGTLLQSCRRSKRCSAAISRSRAMTLMPRYTPTWAYC